MSSGQACCSEATPDCKHNAVFVWGRVIVMASKEHTMRQMQRAAKHAMGDAKFNWEPVSQT